MTVKNFDATTPQLKAVKNLLEAYLTLDMTKVHPLVSKNYEFQTFPKITGLPDEAKEGHLERYGALFSLLSKVELNVQEVIEAPGKVVLQIAAICHTTDADPNQIEYDSLSIFTLVEEDGEHKVASFKDFSDPEKRANLHGWAAKRIK